MADKIRTLLPVLNSAIIKLTSMSGDIIKLEYQDNDKAAARLKRILVSFKNEELRVLGESIKEVRQHTIGIKELRKMERQKEYEAGTKTKNMRGFFNQEAKEALQSKNQ